MNEVTRVLEAVEAGDHRAAAELLPLVYDELRRLAAGHLAHERPGHTLNATALVHEAYARLVGPLGDRTFANRGHFFVAAAEAMRRVLIDSARRHQANRRGGGVAPFRIDVDRLPAPNMSASSWLDLNDALDALRKIDPRAADLAQLRVFGGLATEEAADVLNVSRATAFRTWKYARAWLSAALADRPENF